MTDCKMAKKHDDTYLSTRAGRLLIWLKCYEDSDGGRD